MQAVKYLMVASNACFIRLALLRLDPVPLYGQSEAVKLETRCARDVFLVQVPEIGSCATGDATLDRGFVAWTLALKLRPVGVCTTRVLVHRDGCADQEG